MERDLLQEATDFFLSCNEDRMDIPQPSSNEISTLSLRVKKDDSTTYTLRRAEWSKRVPYRLVSERLIIRPFAEADHPSFHIIAAQHSVARMLVNLEHPLSAPVAEEWLNKRRYVGRLGFMVGIFNHDDRLLGSIGIGGLSNSLVYFLDESVRGKGIGTEAVSLFLDDVIARFALKNLSAGVFTDNPASRHLLEKLGFIVTGTSLFHSPARARLEPFWEMALSQED
ncbi:MAG: GNAT family N-acetyltransferase [Lentilitoribacter sp.]